MSRVVKRLVGGRQDWKPRGTSMEWRQGSSGPFHPNFILRTILQGRIVGLRSGRTSRLGALK
jgi:hypothetical protein